MMFLFIRLMNIRIELLRLVWWIKKKIRISSVFKRCFPVPLNKEVKWKQKKEWEQKGRDTILNDSILILVTTRGFIFISDFTFFPPAIWALKFWFLCDNWKAKKDGEFGSAVTVDFSFKALCIRVTVEWQLCSLVCCGGPWQWNQDLSPEQMLAFWGPLPMVECLTQLWCRGEGLGPAST